MVDLGVELVQADLEPVEFGVYEDEVVDFAAAVAGLVDLPASPLAESLGGGEVEEAVLGVLGEDGLGAFVGDVGVVLGVLGGGAGEDCDGVNYYS